MAKIDKRRMNKTTKILLIILTIATLLRLWRIGEVPVSLFGDELDVGYHAYSILKTGKDYSGNIWPLHFQSLAEWRTPLYLYSAVPTVALFGISPLGVRLPAAIFGILGVLGMYMLVRELGKNNQSLALLAAAVLALSPWHIQYSRAAFEVTMFLALLLFGLYFFFKSLPAGRQGLKSGKYLWISGVLLALTPWVYSTAKLFTPLLLIFLILTSRKDLLKLSKRYLIWAVLALALVGAPIAHSTLYGGGAQRFGYLSVFTDPTRETEIGAAREFDARVRGEISQGLQPTLVDKITHNKFAFWSQKVVSNYFRAFSTDFLFIKGDLNLRHSIDGVGQFYWIEAIALILGVIFFFSGKNKGRMKLLLAFWLIFGVVPAAITRNGGNHATRLILILPPLVFLISYGIFEGLRQFKGNARKLIAISYLLLFALEFGFYQHFYWIHNPWDSERWWHSGFKEAIQSIKEIDENYDRVFISMAGEPAWIFFAGWYEYPPEKWHAEFPIGNDVFVDGFGKISHTGKFYFGSPSGDGGFYSLSEFISESDLYLAVAKEVGTNLIMEPERSPPGLNLIKAIPYPSGEPAFYLFSGTQN